VLGDIIKKGRSLESRKVRVWKAKCEVKKARTDMVDILENPRGKMAQITQEEGRRQLEEAEFKFLSERDGTSDKLTFLSAQARAMQFILRANMRLKEWTPEPLHPILDLPRAWLHSHHFDDLFDFGDIYGGDGDDDG
jgi:hypothetical protein